MIRSSPRIPRHARRLRRGITLIEALATILVLGIVLPAIMGALTTETRVAGQARRKADAATLADGKLAELMATGNPQAGSGTFDQAPDYAWQAQVVDWEEAGIQEITVIVSWPDRDTRREVTVSTLYYPPATTSTTQASASATVSAGGLTR